MKSNHREHRDHREFHYQRGLALITAMLVVAIAATLGIAGAVVAGVLIQRPSWRFVVGAVVAAASFYAGRHTSADLTTPLLGLAVGGALTALRRF